MRCSRDPSVYSASLELRIAFALVVAALRSRPCLSSLSRVRRSFTRKYAENKRLYYNVYVVQTAPYTCKLSASGARVKWRLCLASQLTISFEFQPRRCQKLCSKDVFTDYFGDNHDLYRNDSKKSVDLNRRGSTVRIDGLIACAHAYISHTQLYERSCSRRKHCERREQDKLM